MSDLPSAFVTSDDLPLLTEVLEGKRLNDLPVLTEIIPETEIVAAPAEHCISEEALLAALQQKIGAHIETVFAQKLAPLQQQAAEQTLAELKATLPDLLHDALKTTCRMG